MKEEEEEEKGTRGELEARLREMLLGRREGQLSEDAVRALVRMVEEIARICQEVLAVAIAGLPFPSEDEIARMETRGKESGPEGGEPVSQAAYQIAEIWQASLDLEDAEGHLAEFRRPPMARKGMPVLLRAARLEVKTRRSPERGASPELQRFAKRLLEKKV